MKTFLIMFGIEIFLKWLSSGDRAKNTLLNDLFRSQSVFDLETIAKKQSTKDVISEMVDFAARERLGDVFGKLIGRLLK